MARKSSNALQNVFIFIDEGYIRIVQKILEYNYLVEEPNAISFTLCKSLFLGDFLKCLNILQFLIN